MAAPITPTNFVLQTGQGENFLSWDIIAGAATYLVQRSLDGVTFTVVATITGSPLENFYLDGVYDPVANPGGVQPATTYYYSVAAQNGSGTSAYTSAQSIVPAPIGQVSLAYIRYMALLRADLLNSQFISLAEVNSYISASYKELYDLLIQKFEDEYYSDKMAYVTTVQNQQLYPLPADFYKSTLVEVTLNPSDPTAWVTLKRYQKIQQNLLNFPNVYTYWGFTNLRYRFTGNNLQIVPVTIAGQTLRIWYAPRPQILMQDTQLLDGISGWEEYVIVDAARKMLQKQEQDTSELVAEKAALMLRIESAAENRDIAEPATVSDSRRRNFGWSDGDSGQGWNSGGGYF